MLLFNFLGPEMLFIFFALLGIASLVLSIWAAVEIATKPFKREKDRVIWLMIVLLFGLIGPIIYLTKRKELLADPETPPREYLPPLENRSPERLYDERTGDTDQYV